MEEDAGRRTEKVGISNLKSWIPGLVTYVAFSVLSAFLPVFAFWLASVLFAFCIGALWGIGNQIRKQREAAQLPVQS